MQLLLYALQTGEPIPKIYPSPNFKEPNWNDPYDIKAKTFEPLSKVLLDYLNKHHIWVSEDWTLRELLDALENEKLKHKACFTWWLKVSEESPLLQKISLDRFLLCKPLPLDEVLEQFDYWAKRMRDSIAKSYKRGYISVGQSIDFPDLLDYTTQYMMAPTPEEAINLTPNSSEEDKTIWHGEINL